jgi:hypothetical protein
MSPYKGTWREYRWDERRLKYPSFALVVCRAFGWASSDPARFVTTIRHAVDMGLNFLDTAAAYGDGYSEELVSKAITGRRGQVVIATKFNLTTVGGWQMSAGHCRPKGWNRGTRFGDGIQRTPNRLDHICIRRLIPRYRMRTKSELKSANVVRNTRITLRGCSELL